MTSRSPRLRRGAPFLAPLPLLAATLALAGLAVLGGCAEDEAVAPGAPGARRSLLVVTVDTLRADHLGCYGYERETSPALDAFAASGVLFENATTPRPKTAPSMTSLLSGLYPHEHGIRTNFGVLPDVRLALDPNGPLRPDPESPALLAERLGAAGLVTGAVVSNYVLERAASGLARGFANYDDTLDSAEATRTDVPERKAHATTEAALGWLRAHSREPFFLWVHYVDPHGAYTPPAEHRLFAGPAGERVPLGAMREEAPRTPDGHRIFVAVHNLLRDEDGKRILELGPYVDRYDGEIHYVDAELARLLAELARLGRDRDTLVVFSADHGESLGEHGVWFEHGYDLYDTSLRLPFVARLPGGRAGARVDAPVDLIDLWPSALEWLGLPPEPGLPGRSFLPALAQDAPASALDPERIAFTERMEFGFVQRAARSADWKLVHNERSPDARTWPFAAARELYDLGSDPAERVNLFESPAPQAVAARARLEPALAAWARGARATSAREERDALLALPPERRAALQALGYAGEGTPASGATPATPDALEHGPPDSDDPEDVLVWALEQPGELAPLALEGLARAGRIGTAELLSRLDGPASLGTRVRAVELLAELGDERADARLAELARTAPEDALRLAAHYALARRLGASAGDADFAPLLAAAGHWSAAVRALDAWYLDRLGAPPRARAALQALAGDSAGTVRVLALRALGRAALGASGGASAAASGGKAGTALDELLAEARGADPSVARAAGLALAELGRVEEVAQLARAFAADAHPLRQAAARELGAWNELGAARHELAARTTLESELRRRLVHAGGLRAGGDAEELLAQALHDEDAETRVLAALHLLRRRGPR